MKNTQELNGHLAEVSSRLAYFQNLKPGNHYYSPTPTLGLSVPQPRSALKEGYSFIKLSEDKILAAFTHIWNNAVYFEEMPDQVMPVLKAGTKMPIHGSAGNRWSAFFTIRGCAKPLRDLKKMIEMVEALPGDKEYYLQKWGGWTLKEIYNLHPRPTLDFIEKNVNLISTAAWQSSTEKLPRNVKDWLLKQRKKI